MPAEGPASVAVPGTVAGLTMALQKYGTMKLPQVVAPAIRLAEQGFVISPTLAGVLVDNFEPIAKNEALAAIVLPGGLPIEAGGTLKNPDLAASLRKIAAGGADVFYRGEIADAIAKEMAARGGRITKADLASYKAVERAPVRGQYRGYDIVSAPPPVGGASVVEILQILDQIDLSKEAPLSPRYVHVAAEAMKRGFADFSAAIGDPDFVEVPLAKLLSKEYAAARAAEIRPDAITPKVTAGDFKKHESPSTTSLSVVDAQGNMVALTQTISGLLRRQGRRARHGHHPQQRDEELRHEAARTRSRRASGCGRRSRRASCSRTGGRSRRSARRAPRASSRR